MPPILSKREQFDVRLAPALEVKLDPRAAVDGVIQGYASPFGGPPDAYGDVIEPGAFQRTLAEHKAAGTAPSMLWSHNQAEPIGRWTELREDGAGLYVRGALNLETSRGRDAHAHLKAGDVNGLSIGYFIMENGYKAGPGGTKLLIDVDLMEISVVAMPANRRARVTLDSKSNLIELLQKSGVTREAAFRLAAGGWPALVGDDPDEKARQIQIAAERVASLTRNMRTEQ